MRATMPSLTFNRSSIECYGTSTAHFRKIHRISVQHLEADLPSDPRGAHARTWTRLLLATGATPPRRSLRFWRSYAPTLIYKWG